MGSVQSFPDGLLPLNAVSDCISCTANALVVYRLKEACNTWRELSVSIPPFVLKVVAWLVRAQIPAVSLHFHNTYGFKGALLKMHVFTL